MTPPPIELSPDELAALIARIKERKLLDDDYKSLEAMGETIGFLSQTVNDKNTSIKRLLKMLFGASSEKTENIVEKTKPDPQKTKRKKKKKRKGHGRNGTSDYTGAEKVCIPHSQLKHKDPCPACLKGKVYVCKPPKTLIRVTGQCPLSARVYAMEKPRCNLCGEIFTANAPDNIGTDKYDAPSGAMIALLKYGNGFPFYRLEKLQGSVGIPVPASTQWDVVRDFSSHIYPVFAELIRHGACGQVIHNDDTTMKILSLVNEAKSSERDVYHGNRVDLRGSKNRFVFYRATACRGKPVGFACKTRSGPWPPHTDVRRVVEKLTQGI